MNIDSSTTVAGVPILKVRSFLRRWTNDAWTPLWMAREMDISNEEAVAVIKELEADGFLELKSEREWHEEHVAVQGSETPLGEWDLSESPAWSTTIKGNALAMASAARPVLRKTAERVLAEFLDRVKEVRESDTYLYRVKRVVLFGSMLDQNRSHVNDIDLVVELVVHRYPSECSRSPWHEGQQRGVMTGTVWRFLESPFDCGTRSHQSLKAGHPHVNCGPFSCRDTRRWPAAEAMRAKGLRPRVLRPTQSEITEPALGDDDVEPRAAVAAIQTFFRWSCVHS